MADPGAVVVVGGTRAIGLEIVRSYAARGAQVILTGRDMATVGAAVAEVGGATRGLAFDLSDPTSIAGALADVGPVRRLVLAAIDRDANSVADYSIERAIRLVTLKLVGYTETVHALRERLTDDASVVLFGGMAKERPYPGSTTVTTVNGGIVGLTRTLVEELKPVRVNSIHPGIIDTPMMEGYPIEEMAKSVPLGRYAGPDEVAKLALWLASDASGYSTGSEFLVDGGYLA